jgi:transglutaminase-like putative cysteine protease
MKKNALTFCLILCACCLYAQQEDLYTKFKQKFPDDPAVFVERSEVMNISVDGDSLRVYADVFEDVIHLKEQSDVFASKRVYGSHFNSVENLRAKTLLWEKNRYKELNVSDFRRSSERGQGIFYDDSYFYTFNFPSVASKNRTQLQYRESLKDPRFISGYIFQSYLPQGRVSFSIKTTKDVDLQFHVLNDAENRIRFRKSVKGNSVTYEWEATDLPSVKSEQNSPPLRYTAPHVVCYVRSFQSRKGKVNVLSSLDDLYSWYRTFVRDLTVPDSEELVNIVQQLKQKSASEVDLVKNVYYWVQSNIRYIAFEDGMRGLIPHNGSYVCEKRYGDCKDMANLIVTMLRIANVPAYHTWIGTRDIPYRYTAVPTPLVDNHMIATYFAADGRYYFLDATSAYTPFGYPSSMIQGKEALVGINEDEYRILEVPVVPSAGNAVSDSVTIRLEGNLLMGEGTSTLSGYVKVFAGYEMDRAGKDDIRKYLTSTLAKGSNKFYLDDYQIRNLQDQDQPTEVSYKFRISDYHQQLGKEIFVNLNFNKDKYNEFINLAVRKKPVENEYHYRKNDYVAFAIPQGYSVEYVPENFSFDNGIIACQIRYLVEGGEIRYSKDFSLNYLLLAPGDFVKWNEAIKMISEAYKESIILIRN